MDRDNASTATQADSGMTRRGVMRRGLIASGATLGVGYAGSRTGAIGGARAAVPIVGFAAISLGYLAVAGAEKYLGDSRDYSGYTGGDALHLQLEKGALAMKSANERVMTSIQNNLVNSKNIAFSKGKIAAIEVMNNDGSEADAVNSMNNAVEDYYSTIQTNIITHFEAQAKQIVHHYQQVKNNSGLDRANVFAMDRDNVGSVGDPDGNASEISTSVTLVDDSTLGYTAFEASPSGFNATQFTATGLPMYWQLKKADGSGKITYLSVPDFKSAFNECVTKSDEVKSTLSGFVSDLYAQYSSGDIPTEDLVDPITAATELGQNYGGDAEQSAFASMLGIPTSADQAVTMTIHRPDGNVTILADIYTDYTPPDTGEFVKETRYEPTTWEKPIYIAYEYTDSETGEEASDFVQLENPFTIISIEANGEEIDSFAPKARTTQTADISAIEEELAKIREEQQRLQEEAEKETSSGGGAGAGFFSDLGGSPSNLGLVALGGAVVALLLGNR